MACWSGVEDYEIKVILIKTLEHLSKTRGLIDTRYTILDLLKESLRLVLHLLSHALHLSGCPSAEAKSINQGPTA